ncbi:MAG: hypothetical protein ABI165_22010 [Bryobacteraceae bacterium]
MSLISVSGEPGSRREELARAVAQSLQCEFVDEPRLGQLLAGEFGAETPIPDRAWPHAVASILAQFAARHHVVAAIPAAELLAANFPNILRINVIAPEARRIGNLMLDHGLERAAARDRLRELEARERLDRKNKFGRTKPLPARFDLILNADTFDAAGAAAIVEAAMRTRGMLRVGLLSDSAQASLQFQLRLQLARYGLVPAGQASLQKAVFSHPSEQMFANLLDFYRIAWEYEPRSFPLQWDKDGRVAEAFTPDFYLFEADLYVELTTMKQSLVTRKNRKVKLLRAIYPHINIQVFYQKDFQNLVFKYGLPQPVETA